LNFSIFFLLEIIFKLLIYCYYYLVVGLLKIHKIFIYYKIYFLIYFLTCNYIYYLWIFCQPLLLKKLHLLIKSPLINGAQIIFEPRKDQNRVLFKPYLLVDEHRFRDDPLDDS